MPADRLRRRIQKLEDRHGPRGLSGMSDAELAAEEALLLAQLPDEIGAKLAAYEVQGDIDGAIRYIEQLVEEEMASGALRASCPKAG
ncbi:MAG: hypothetical protein AAFP17_15255 [Pseudomonadota bacterium]